jgi:hypothetical protein
MSPTADVSAALLSASEPLTCDDLEELTGHPRKNISALLCALVNVGAVERIVNKEGGKHHYQLKDQEQLQKRVKKSGGAKPEKVTKPPKATKPPKRTTLHDLIEPVSHVATSAAPIAANVGLKFLIGDDAQVRIIRADGTGEIALLSAAEATRLCDFLESVSSLLEAAS